MYATVQESNPCMNASIHNCVEEKLAYRYKIFLKKQEKSTRLSNTVLSMNQDKKTTHKLQSKYWSGVTKTTYSSLGSPVESPVLLYRNKHLITEGLGLPTYSINLQTIDSRVQ